MGVLGIAFFPVGVILIFCGAVFVFDSPFIVGTFDKVAFLRKNRRIVGFVVVLLGFVLMALS